MGGERGSPHDVVAQLLSSAANGDQRAWNKLVERVSALLWSICRSYGLAPADAADAFQLTWLRLLEHLETIEEPARLAGWLGTTCRRECMAILRRGRRLLLSSDDALFDRVTSPAPGPDRATLLSDRDAELWVAFGRLSERCQRLLRVLVLEPEDGAPSYDMAAAVLGMPKGSLGPTRGRCLDQLRKYLDGGGISTAGT
jgi:RNA polymerase sigma factor (sigma-70 family)